MEIYSYFFNINTKLQLIDYTSKLFNIPLKNISLILRGHH